MVWKVHGKGKPVLEVWESFNGDLYFITEKKKNGDIFCYARLYSMPQFAEWGYNNINYLREQYGKYKLWKVHERSYPNIVSYEKGLLQEVKKPVKVSKSKRARAHRRRKPRKKK